MDNDKRDDPGEREVTDWLESFQKPEDRRSRDEVLSRLKEDPRLNSRKKRPPRRWIPVAVAAAALITFVALFASMQGSWNNSASDDSAKESSVEMTRESSYDAADAELYSSPGVEESGPGDAMTAMEDRAGTGSWGAVYPAQVEGSVPFIIGLTDQAAAVPVTFLLSEEQVKEDFGGTVPDIVALYNRYAWEIDEATLGFDDYHPYEGEIRLEGDEVIHILPPGHPYDAASSPVTVYTDTVRETFAGFSRFLAVGPDGRPAEFSQIGPMEPIALGEELRSGYFAFTKTDGTTVLAPDLSAQPEDVAEAMYLIQKTENDLYRATIPGNATFTVHVDERQGVAAVRFDEPLDLGSMDREEAARMIDSIALTAASFGMRAQLENTAGGVQGYDLSAPLEMPVGANGMLYESE
ncbi:hypothetical protein [Bhargavaea cecembensis]|uniref:hypothetical protein n=1 Tax=Bhargavaea cecembensis TaxID=394098 RepID=UPI00059081EE|nr:hypothetical protein [Bhargavaea cecembensis]